ncbi:hypothetical protein FIBSPDRAFT_1037455 [Athelia psychrophila]|uniref:Uncharacterized protein n=1 Tax=Athelia psychrophila TaxID=1759441 RepID=A0A166U9E2_9AGAM|nr:hypothetical protein FIBSPDRAFT_1037455 [Fibularhizoctonia sp. CBS 109695]
MQDERQSQASTTSLTNTPRSLSLQTVSNQFNPRDRIQAGHDSLCDALHGPSTAGSNLPLYMNRLDRRERTEPHRFTPRTSTDYQQEIHYQSSQFPHPTLQHYEQMQSIYPSNNPDGGLWAYMDNRLICGSGTGFVTIIEESSHFERTHNFFT